MIERKKSGRPTKRPSSEKLSTMYKTMTAKEISHIYEVSEDTVRSWILYYRRKERGVSNDKQ